MVKHPLPLLLIAGCVAAGCSPDQDPEYLVAAAPLPALESPVIPADVAGTWYTRIEKNAVNCGAGETIDGQVILITQDAAEITMLTSAGDQYTGSVNGDIVEWAGSYLERGGSASFTSASIVFSADAGSGNAAWTWSNGSDSCNGTMAITAARNGGVTESGSNSWPAIADTVEFVNNVAFYNGSLGVNGDEFDYFTFTPATDVTLQAELSHFDTSSTDLDVIVYDSGLNQIAMSSNADKFEMLEVQLMGGTRYYVEVVAMSLAGPDTYHLSLDIN